MTNTLISSKEAVSKLRNRAIHVGEEVKSVDARKALESVKEFIYSVRPIENF